VKGRKTGGRKKGTPNKATVLKRIAEEAAANASPLEFLASVYRSSKLDPRLRLDAAKAADAFVHPKPSNSISEPDRNLKIIDSRQDDPARMEWTRADYTRLIELEIRRTESGLEDREEEELAALTARMPCTHEEDRRLNDLGLDSPLKPPTADDIRRTLRELDLTPGEIERIIRGDRLPG